MDDEKIAFQMILHAGDARNYVLEALESLRGKRYAEAKELIAKAKEELSKAHGVQTGLLQGEASGDKHSVSLLMVHAQDHLMTAILAKDLVGGMISLFEQGGASREERSV